MRVEIENLRSLMKESGIDYYLVPTRDYHDSEYVGDYFKFREFLSGFTGSNGTLLVGIENAYLWTDGRYFIQADNELKNSGIKVMRMGERDVPTIKQFLTSLNRKIILGINSKICGAKSIIEYEKDENIKVVAVEFEEQLWKDRPKRNANKVIVVDMDSCGESYLNKLLKVKDEMKQKDCKYHFLTKLDDIMWLFNIRGCDVDYNPVALSFALVTKDESFLFLQKDALSEELLIYSRMNNIVLMDYDEIYSFLQELFGNVDDSNPNILLDLSQMSYAIYGILKDKTNIIDCTNPTTKLKAIKNETEIENLRDYFLKDSVAVCKFLYWIDRLRKNLDNSYMGGRCLKDERGNIITEQMAADYLDMLRSNIRGFRGLSFRTISAYGANAAMMHYEADNTGGALLQNKGFLLVDSGGQYDGATTDVTRTIVLGELTREQKRDFTLVCKGMLNLQNAKFIQGCTGRNLDIIAREPLWQLGIDYKCGTGHGVGCFLNVHEGPHAIRWKYNQNEIEAVLEPGMTITDEPGVYKENEYGIRTENTLLITEFMNTQDGKFLQFEPLTFVPIDTRAIDPEYLDQKDIEQLVIYQNEVCEKLMPYLTEEEGQWLVDLCEGKI